jgi:hypothetical protein
MTPLIGNGIKNKYRVPGYTGKPFSLFQGPSEGTYNVPIKSVMNAQANDNEYYQKSVTGMRDYLSNNGKWQERAPGVWHHIDNGTTFDFNKWKTNANSNASVNMVSSLGPMYVSSYNGSDVLTHPDDTIRYNQVQLNPFTVKENISAIPHDTSRPGPWANVGSADNSLYSTKYLTDSQNLALVGGHEINHNLMHGVYQGLVPEGYSYNGRQYALMPSELYPAAAKFHRQYFANTGKTITPDNFSEGINYARQNIGYFDSESRRFMEYIDYLEKNKNNDPRAKTMLNSTIDNMPLFRGRPAEVSNTPGFPLSTTHNK